jgi:hypothetical protein
MQLPRETGRDYLSLEFPDPMVAVSFGAKVSGPIPAIVVDQFGYLTQSRKVAVIRDPQVGYDSSAKFEPSKSYALIELPTGKIVKTAPPIAWNGGSTDQVSGDEAWWFDFSEVEAPGRYAVVDLEKSIRSADFSIGEHVYKDVMKHVLRAFYYQRAGLEKKPEFAGRAWADKASHLGPGQDTESRPWHEGRPSNPFSKSLIKDLRGGWYDAGDFNKYTSWAARYIIVLLRAYAEHPQAFSDDYGIPESGNGIPDILDEVKWGLDWLVRMQNSDGPLLCVQGLASASPPSDAKGGSYYGPPTTSATLMGAAAFAYASKFFASRPEPDLKRYGDDLKKRATAAWTCRSRNRGSGKVAVEVIPEPPAPESACGRSPRESAPPHCHEAQQSPDGSPPGRGARRWRAPRRLAPAAPRR